MPVTININGLSLCHQGSEGVANASLPDVCLTPKGNTVVPIPYGNTAESKDLQKGSKTVTFDSGMPAAIQGSMFAVSTGDEGGVVGGVSSGLTCGEAKFIAFSPDVKIEGKAACRLSDKLSMNKGNTACMGGLVQPTVQAEGVEGTKLKKWVVTNNNRFSFSR